MSITAVGSSTTLWPRLADQVRQAAGVRKSDFQEAERLAGLVAGQIKAAGPAAARLHCLPQAKLARLIAD